MNQHNYSFSGQRQDGYESIDNELQDLDEKINRTMDEITQIK